MTIGAAEAVVPPLPRVPGDHAATAVHAHLRALILNGSIPPGAFLNQVELAPLLGVSRTPLREAIRMLQEEGLVVAEPQRRARVTGFDPEHLEAIYTQRVLLEGTATRVTATSAGDDDVAHLDALLDQMRTRAALQDLKSWEQAHRTFHLELVSGVGSHLTRAITNHMDRAEHYRLMHQATGPRAWASGAAEHAAIVDAYRRRDGDAAASELAAHLARTALSLIAQMAPTYDPVAIRSALKNFHATPRVERVRSDS